MSAYDLEGKFSIVTGADFGICHGLTKQLLEAGCSVMMADLRRRPEAEVTRSAYSDSKSGAPSATFHKTDISDWL